MVIENQWGNFLSTVMEKKTSLSCSRWKKEGMRPCMQCAVSYRICMCAETSKEESRGWAWELL